MYNLPHEYHPEDDIICSGLPSEEAFQQLAGDGVVTAVNLRPNSEDPGRSLKDEVESAGIEYLHIPIGGRGDFTREAAETLKKSIDSAREKGGKIYVFCGSSNRVGGLFALKSYLFDGKSKEEALQYGESAGLKSIKAMIAPLLDDFDA